MKSRTAEAQNIAHELAANYEVSTPVDTIICMDGLEVIGAYLSEELTKAGIFPWMLIRRSTWLLLNPAIPDRLSSVIIFSQWSRAKCTDPQWFDYHRLYFVQSNREHSVLRRHYQRYRSHIQQSRQRGFSPCIFYFNTKDIPDYHSYSSTKCPMCQRQQKIDAIVSSYGYSAL